MEDFGLDSPSADLSERVKSVADFVEQHFVH
jgi:hypothetical protein